jgi:hypothetical protein
MALVVCSAFAGTKTNFYQMSSNVTTGWEIKDKNVDVGTGLTNMDEDILITNNDATYDIWVDFNGIDLTTCDYGTQKCFLLGAGESMQLNDVSSSGVEIFPTNLYGSTVRCGASPVSVVITY